MRGDHHPHINRDGFGCADSLQLAFFQYAQQLGLHGEGHIVDFVEQERAAMRLFKLAECAAAPRR